VGKYQRGAAFSVVAVPFMAFGAWGLSKLTADPISLASAFGIAVFLAVGMIAGMFKLGRGSSDPD
jgi:hypothetical protein